MTHLLQYFPQLSLRPENLPELRRLILQLAVEGKLTAEWRKENPDVEPASELLSRIAAEKAALVIAKQIKKEKPLSPIKQSEYPFEVPEGWVWCRFATTAYIARGGSPRPIKSYLTTSEEGINWIKIGDASKETKYITTTKEKIIPEGMKKSRFVEPGDFILSNSMSFGRPYIMKTSGCIHDGWLTIKKPDNIISSEFLYYMLSSNFISKSFEKAAAGGVVRNLNIQKVRKTLIPIPPLPEQQAIVQTVDALLQELDQLQQRSEVRLQLKADYATAALRRLTTAPAVGPAWEALSPHFHTFFNETGNVPALRAAILQLAVQGKLTAQWRNAHPDVEPATELLSRIQAEKAALVKAKKIKKEKPLPPVGAEEVPFDLPEGWVWCRLGGIQLNIEAGKSPKCNSTPAGDDQWGVIKMSAISWGTFNGEENKSLPADVPPFVDKEIMPGDFILTRANTAELIARSVVVPEDCPSKLLLNDKTLRVVFSKNLSIEYLNLYNNSSSARDYYKVNSSGTSDSMKNISRAAIKGLPVSLPPLPEQQAIVHAVEELLGLCTALEGAAARRERVLGEWVRAVVGGG